MGSSIRKQNVIMPAKETDVSMTIDLSNVSTSIVQGRFLYETEHGINRLLSLPASNMHFMGKIIKLTKSSDIMAEYEHNLLKTCLSSPFFIRSYGCINLNPAKNIVLVKEFLPGGSLFSYIRHFGKLTERQTLFFLPQLILALEYLHSHGILCRILCPEYVLIGADGYIRLSELSGAIEEPQKVPQVVGVPEYCAPEVVLKQIYVRATDCWCLGVFIYELLTGITPFNSMSDLNSVFRGILHFPIAMPTNCGTLTSSFIRRLLRRDVAVRLGSNNGASSLKSDPLLQNIDWIRFEKKVYSPPFLPIVDCPNDTRNYPESIDSANKNIDRSKRKIVR